MNELTTWYLGLDPSLQIFWGCALISSGVFAIQTVMTLIGMDNAEMDMDADFDGDTMDTGGYMSLFSIRSLVNFFVGFGWAGISFYNVIPVKFLLFAVAIAIGIGFGYMYVFLRKRLMRLESNGAVDINDSLGKEAEVYLRIPANNTGAGKVQISLGGSIHEMPAITEGNEIPSGKRIIVTKVLDNKTLLVEEI